MNMTKKEQQRLADAEKDAQYYKALLYAVLGIEEVKRDLPAPQGNGEFTQGYDYNAHAGNVYEAWSETVRHGEDTDRKHGQQYGIALYSTHEKALAAMMYETKMMQARELVRVLEKNKGENHE